MEELPSCSWSTFQLPSIPKVPGERDRDIYSSKLILCSFKHQPLNIKFTALVNQSKARKFTKSYNNLQQNSKFDWSVGCWMTEIYILQNLYSFIIETHLQMSPIRDCKTWEHISSPYALCGCDIYSHQNLDCTLIRWKWPQ